MAELAEHAPQKTDLKTTALNTLRSVFGYQSFRKGQFPGTPNRTR